MPATVVGETIHRNPPGDRGKHPVTQPHVDRSGSGAASGSAAAAPIDAAAVSAKFSAVAREYKAFKKSYGSRLEGDWTEIATDSQYARTPEKLRDLDKKLDHFRAEMKAAQ